MSQKSKFWKASGAIDYTMGTDDGTAGYPYQDGDYAGILATDLDAGALGALIVEGIFEVNKDSSSFSAGDTAYWDNDGTDVGGDTGGAASSTASDFALGRVFAAAGTAATTVKVVLNEFGADDANADITDNSTGTAGAAIGTFSSAGTDWSDDVDVVKDAIATLVAEQNAIKATLRKSGVLKP